MIKQMSKMRTMFCSLAKDYIYELGESSVSLCVRLNKLKDFNDFERLKSLKINRIIYNLNDDAELMSMLSEHHDHQIKEIFDKFLFRGINFHVHTVMKDDTIRKIDQRALLQICQHIFKIGQKRTQFQLFLSLQHHQQIKNEAAFLLDAKEHLDDMQSVVENSFNFELNNTIDWNQHFSFEMLFKLINAQPTLKSLDLNVFKYANPQNSEIDQNREILATFYQNATQNYNTIFLRNFIHDNQFEEQSDLSEGIVSYSHFVDMLKLMHFRGSLVLDYNKHIEKNIGFIDQLLTTSKYIAIEKPILDDTHEVHIVEADIPPIDV